jgi:DnaJ-class molecular chaperone
VRPLRGPLRHHSRKGSRMPPKIKEHTCPLCNGTGFPKSKEPTHPGRKIYPVKCESCQGKGKISEMT